MKKSKLCIDDFGVIMHDALDSALTQDDDIPCIYLDGDEYTEEDFERFLKDVEKVQVVDSYVIDGFADSKDDLCDITFMGDFSKVFKDAKREEIQ